MLGFNVLVWVAEGTGGEGRKIKHEAGICTVHDNA